MKDNNLALGSDLIMSDHPLELQSLVRAVSSSVQYQLKHYVHLIGL